MNTFRINGAWSALGLMLALVALYLVLQNSRGFSRVTGSGANALGQLFAVLQGRTASVGRAS